jgi:DNA-directed RNA polymerase sigma subunit (sigma70/sigma32)
MKLADKQSSLSAESGLQMPAGAAANGYEVTDFYDVQLLPDNDGQELHLQQTTWHRDFHKALLMSLTPEERRSVSLRFGIFDDVQRSEAHVAELMCMSLETQRMILKRALKKMKTANGGNSSFEDFLTGPPEARAQTEDGRMPGKRF